MTLKDCFKFSHRLSRIFQPLALIPKGVEVKHHEITSKSQRLMLEMGLIKQSNQGCFHLLPLAMRSLQKLTEIVDYEMENIGGQKVEFPTFTNVKLWETSGRLEAVSSELFRLKDRHQQEFILSPTYEESVAELIASVSPITHKLLPMKLYQITSKFRDEMKPRFGLIRSKQFLMKDLYSFDIDYKSALDSYNEVSESYNRIFDKIGIDYVKVLGSSGHMGGNLSHEYHYQAEIGDDKILNCLNCQFIANTDISGEEHCPQCKSKSIEIHHGIEVGHTFLLGDKYSKSFHSTYLSKESKPNVIQMGSYGLGLSRIIAAALEVLSTPTELRWPLSLAPYKIIVLPPKRGSKEEKHLSTDSIENLLRELQQIPGLKNNVLLDDRTELTIGRRYVEAKKFGYPFIVVFGKKIFEEPPQIEITNENEQLFLTENDLLKYFENRV